MKVLNEDLANEQLEIGSWEVGPEEFELVQVGVGPAEAVTAHPQMLDDRRIRQIVRGAIAT